MKKPDMNRVAQRAAGKGALNLDFVIDVAVGIWRIEQSLRREHDSQDELVETRSWRNLQRLWAQLDRRGITVQDKTGEPFDPGMSVRVVASEEQPKLTREIVQETISPSVFHNDTLIRAGEIVVGKPPIAQIAADQDAQEES